MINKNAPRPSELTFQFVKLLQDGMGHSTGYFQIIQFHQKNNKLYSAQIADGYFKVKVGIRGKVYNQIQTGQIKLFSILYGTVTNHDGKSIFVMSKQIKAWDYPRIVGVLRMWKSGGVNLYVNGNHYINWAKEVQSDEDSSFDELQKAMKVKQKERQQLSCTSRKVDASAQVGKDILGKKGTESQATILSNFDGFCSEQSKTNNQLNTHTETLSLDLPKVAKKQLRLSQSQEKKKKLKIINQSQSQSSRKQSKFVEIQFSKNKIDTFDKISERQSEYFQKSSISKKQINETLNKQNQKNNSIDSDDMFLSLVQNYESKNKKQVKKEVELDDQSDSFFDTISKMKIIGANKSKNVAESSSKVQVKNQQEEDYFQSDSFLDTISNMKIIGANKNVPSQSCKKVQTKNQQETQQDCQNDCFLDIIDRIKVIKANKNKNMIQQSSQKVYTEIISQKRISPTSVLPQISLAEFTNIDSFQSLTPIKIEEIMQMKSVKNQHVKQNMTQIQVLTVQKSKSQKQYFIHSSIKSESLYSIQNQLKINELSTCLRITSKDELSEKWVTIKILAMKKKTDGTVQRTLCIVQQILVQNQYGHIFNMLLQNPIALPFEEGATYQLSLNNFYVCEPAIQQKYVSVQLKANSNDIVFNKLSEKQSRKIKERNGKNKNDHFCYYSIDKIKFLSQGVSLNIVGIVSRIKNIANKKKGGVWTNIFTISDINLGATVDFTIFDPQKIECEPNSPVVIFNALVKKYQNVNNLAVRNYTIYYFGDEVYSKFQNSIPQIESLKTLTCSGNKTNDIVAHNKNYKLMTCLLQAETILKTEPLNPSTLNVQTPVCRVIKISPKFFKLICEVCGKKLSEKFICFDCGPRQNPRKQLSFSFQAYDQTHALYVEFNHSDSQKLIGEDGINFKQFSFNFIHKRVKLWITLNPKYKASVELMKIIDVQSQLTSKLLDVKRIAKFF